MRVCVGTSALEERKVKFGVIAVRFDIGELKEIAGAATLRIIGVRL